MHPAVSRLAAVVSLGALAWSALWACAPAGAFRAPVPFAEGTNNELGLGATYDHVFDATSSELGSPLTSGPNAQLWYSHSFDDWFSVGGTLFGGTTSWVGGGLTLRSIFVRTDPFRLGVDVNGGWLWGEFGVPLGVRLADGVWLVSEPAVRLAQTGSVRVPLGVAWQFSPHWVLDAEVGYADNPFVLMSGGTFSRSRVLDGGVSIAWRF